MFALSLLLLLCRSVAAWEIDKSLINGSPTRYVRTIYRVGLDEAVAMTCSFRNTEASLGYFALGSEADFTGRMIIWHKVDSTGGQELLAVGSRVEPKLAAFHDFKILAVDATTSVLFIPRTSRYHAGYYKCSLSDGGFLHQMIHLNVTIPWIVMRHPLENTNYVAAGAEVRLTCNVKFSYPPPLIYWTYGRARMQKAIRPVAWGPVLSLNNMNETMAGIYTCHADDFLRPPITTSYRVKLLQKEPGAAPRFIKAQYNHAPARFATQKPRYGHLYSLTCRSNGSPTIGFHWFKNTKNVKDLKDPNLSTHTTKNSNGDVVSELQIREFKLQDRGNYTCKAFNSFGSRYFIFKLRKVQDIPVTLRKNSLVVPKPPVDDDDYPQWSRLGSGSGEAPKPASKASTVMIPVASPTTKSSEISGSGRGQLLYFDRSRYNVSAVPRVRARQKRN